MKGKSRNPRGTAASLGEAAKLFRARRFPDVIRLLEPEVFRHRESRDYFFLLGFSCLHTGDLGGAFSYLSRARQLSDDDVPVMLGLAAIKLRRAENEDAIKQWLEVLEHDPSNTVARRGMELLRRGLTRDALQEMIDTGRITTLYPPLARKAPVATILLVTLGALVIVGLAVLAFRVAAPRTPERPGVSGIEIPSEVHSLVETGTDYPFVLTERQVKDTFRRAKKYLLAYDDNPATVEINRILLSNASPAIKERARMLKGFVTPATFDTLKETYPYATVMAQPGLYDGCSVRWRGKIANLRAGKDAITFDLLVGYDQEKELEGIVPITLPFAALLVNGGALEVLGQVSTAGGRLGLQGLAIHKLSQP
jgi:hypothetical protein